MKKPVKDEFSADIFHVYVYIQHLAKKVSRIKKSISCILGFDLYSLGTSDLYAGKPLRSAISRTIHPILHGRHSRVDSIHRDDARKQGWQIPVPGLND